MKERYEGIELEIIEFDACDVVTASDGGEGGIDDL